VLVSQKVDLIHDYHFYLILLPLVQEIVDHYVRSEDLNRINIKIKIKIIGQDRTGQDRTGQDRTGQDRTGQKKTLSDRRGKKEQGTRGEERREGKIRRNQAGEMVMYSQSSHQSAVDDKCHYLLQ
jgi:hypothetical protein